MLLVLLAGCSRGHYRYRADVDAYSILREKTAHSPWEPPPGFDIVPGPGSRLFDPTPLDDPLLPMPAPQLYAFELPQLPERDPRRFRPAEPRPSSPEAGQPVPSVHMASYLAPPASQSAQAFLRLPAVNAVSRPAANSHYPLQPVSFLVQAPVDPATAPNEPPSLSTQAMDSRQAMDARQADTLGGVAASLLPVPLDAWEALPASCRVRMFAFQSLRDEFQRSYGREPSESERDNSPALTLEDIVELAAINSREYQTAKEALYRTALRLSLLRFDYDLKFSTGGNRTAVNYTHDRSDGITVNTLAIPTTLQADKALLTGGDLLMRFANNVVLTFNGPNGFAADVGSDLLLDISQTVFQRDIRFEPLTQAERDVVYAARDFTRFRKVLFTQLATQYYGLIRNYRQVQIDADNYFRLVRAFRQAQEEYAANQLARFQVDQVEQDLLQGRSSLIATCTNLERSFDSLKIRIGLPTETPINVDLTELEQLTLGDELAVKRELVRRELQSLASQRQSAGLERGTLVNSSVVLLDRILDTFATMELLQQAVPDDRRFRELRARLIVDSARETLREVQLKLDEESRRQPIRLSGLFLIATDYVDTAVELVRSQIQLARVREHDETRLAELDRQAEELRDQTAAFRAEYERLINTLMLDQLGMLVDEATRAKEAAAELVRVLDLELGLSDAVRPPDEALREMQAIAAELDTYAAQLIQDIGVGLVPVEIGVDDAMLTALVLRLDLMNERGILADDWRRIKLAADDLKSVLDLQATQVISTRRDVNRITDFTFDESQTRLSATLDLPLNRMAQRNVFRTTLIDYQAGLRRLMALEDDIKFEIRDDLRDLDLDREQYPIAVASAALAFERVVSTAMEQQFGAVTARDFLESQRAYTIALSAVASRHIVYLQNRMNLFLDLELLQVDETGFWPELYNESLQPTPYYQLPPEAFPFYGELTAGLMYSHKIRRMQHVPPGTSMIQRAPEEEELAVPEGQLTPEPLPEPQVPPPVTTDP